MKKILKFFSYLFPIRMQVVESEINGRLEITYENGKKVLNGARSNYSFGNLHRVFRTALRTFSPSWEAVREVLILGYGGGSIAQLLKNTEKFNGNITGVEIDPRVIAIAREHFPEELRGVNMVQGDAEIFLRETARKYDLILVDLFIDDHVPDPFRSEEFIRSLYEKTEESGAIIHNFIFSSPEAEKQIRDQYIRIFDKTKLIHLMHINTVVWAQKNTL